MQALQVNINSSNNERKREDDFKQVKRPYRLLILASHVVQYQTPLFRVVAVQPDIELKVLFCSDSGAKSYYDEGFGHDVKWDIPLLEGYRSEFLPNWSPKPNTDHFFGLINLGIISRLRRREFDAVLIHGWARFTNWLAILTAFASGVPVIMRGETNLLPRLSSGKALIKRAILTRLFRRVSGFLSIGRYNTEFYEEYGVPKEKIFLVPYTVNNDFFFAKAKELSQQKREFKRSLGIPDDVPVIIYCGKLTAVKRPMDLLKAFEEVLQTQKAALVYVGDGNLRSELENYAEKKNLPHVYFVGFQNQTKLPDYFTLADIFSLPSSLEPWGLVVNEAMCFGLPVIVSDQVGASANLVKDGINGFVYPCGQVSVLAERLKMLLADNGQRQKMGEASRQIIEKWSYREDIEGIRVCLSAIQKNKAYPLSS